MTRQIQQAAPSDSSRDVQSRNPDDRINVFENDKVWEELLSYQDGERAKDHWNGDVAAGVGHLSLMVDKQNALDPLSYSHLAMNRAAKNGSLHVVKWLHDYTDVARTEGAMDSAAAGGHLEVCLVSRSE